MPNAAVEIALANGGVAVIDAQDVAIVRRYRWIRNTSGYAQASDRRREKRTVLMHRLILGVVDGEVDHIDHDPLNNRRSNLRQCTRAQNCQNRAPKRSQRSKFKGVAWDARRKKWRAQIHVQRRQIGLGRFTDESEAARAYDRAARVHFGAFAWLNFGGDDAE